MTQKYDGPWRVPGEESTDLYPGLVVHDGRVTGSITAGQTRLPLWAFAWSAIVEGWNIAEENYEIEQYGLSNEDFAQFIYRLCEMRGEFGRLLLVLADAERCEGRMGDKAWWETKRHRKRVGDQMRRCLAVLDEDHADDV